MIFTFTDINECSRPELNNCEHKCSNTQGSFMCYCKPGFDLINGHKCQGTSSRILNLSPKFFMFICPEFMRIYFIKYENLLLNRGRTKCRTAKEKKVLSRKSILLTTTVSQCPLLWFFNIYLNI